MNADGQRRVDVLVRRYTEAFQAYDLGEMTAVLLEADDAERRILDALRRDLTELKIPYSLPKERRYR